MTARGSIGKASQGRRPAKRQTSTETNDQPRAGRVLAKGDAGRQMALALPQEKQPKNRSFIPASSNATARAWLGRANWPEGRLWVWGEAGVGKTHLLHHWSRARESGGRAVQWVEAASLSHDAQGQIMAAGTPVTFMQDQDFVIDHLEGLRDEAALLHLLNHARGAGQQVLLAARHPPARQEFALPDLASRLRATSTVEMGEPDDQLRASLLLSLLAARQLVVAPSVIDWLERHLPRTAEALVLAVTRLDALALARGVPVTRSLARDCLGDLLVPVETFEADTEL